jgi:undecaprenyl-diphosphatase
MVLNTSIFYFFHHLARENFWLQPIVIFFSEYADKVILIFFVMWCGYFLIKKQESLTTVAGHVLAIAGAYGIAWILKVSTAVPRPFLALPDVAPLIIHGGYDSFPSGHAAVFFALATCVFLRHRYVGSMFYFFAGMISLARVMAGVHYPVDVLVGAIIGIAVAYVASLVKFHFPKISL